MALVCFIVDINTCNAQVLTSCIVYITENEKCDKVSMTDFDTEDTEEMQDVSAKRSIKETIKRLSFRR